MRTFITTVQTHQTEGVEVEESGSGIKWHDSNLADVVDKDRICQRGLTCCSIYTSFSRRHAKLPNLEMLTLLLPFAHSYPVPSLSENIRLISF